MRTIVLTSVLAALLSVASLSAKNPDVKVYSNVETTEIGCVKEYISYNEKISQVIDKYSYQYDADGNMEKKTFYKWDNEAGWVSIKKYDYVYNNKGNIDYMTFTEWDNKIGNWSLKGEQFIHIYDNNGVLTAIKQIQVNENENFMANK